MLANSRKRKDRGPSGAIAVVGPPVADSVLRIPYACLGDGRAVRPSEWVNTSDEFKKNNAISCPCGRAVVFKNGSVKTPHFAHRHEGGCAYLQKYKKNGGESDRHLSAKLKLGDDEFRKTATFSKPCCNINGCENVARRVSIKSGWTFQAEYKIGKFRVDAVFLDEDKNVCLAIEVHHTNPTVGEKRKYLRSQDFHYMEVGADDILDSSSCEIIILDSSEGVQLCQACEALDDIGPAESNILCIDPSAMEITHYPIRNSYMLRILDESKYIPSSNTWWVYDGVHYYYVPDWAVNADGNLVESPCKLCTKEFKCYYEQREHYTRPALNVINVIQKGAGSGKTYDSVQLVCDPKHSHKTTFLYVTKVHTAKQVIVDEFNDQLKSGKLDPRIPVKQWTFSRVEKKKTVLECGPEEGNLTIVIGTIDSLVWALDNYCTTKSTNRSQADPLRVAPGDHFAQRRNDVAYNKDVSSPTLKYAGEWIVMDETCLINVDEVQDLSMEYVDIFIKLVRSTRVDFSVIGDKLQSIWYEKNIYTWLQSGDANIPLGIIDLAPPTNVVRRFHNPELMKFCNDVVRFGTFDLPEIESICPDHPRCGFAHTRRPVEHFTSKDEVDLELQLTGFLDTELAENPHYGPGDFVIITPFVASIEAMKRLPLLQTFLEDYWNTKLSETDKAKKQYVFWHKSEAGGQPIDLAESTGMMRFLSIHAAKGTGCSVVFLLGCSEKALRFFSPQRHHGVTHSPDVIYESLINVAITRQKRSLYIQLPHYDTSQDDFVCRVLSGSNSSQPVAPQPSSFCGGGSWYPDSLVTILEEADFEKAWTNIGLSEDHVELMMAAVEDNHYDEIVDWGEHIMRMGVLHWSIVACIMSATCSREMEEGGLKQIYGILYNWCGKAFVMSNSGAFIKNVRALIVLKRQKEFKALNKAAIPILRIEGHDYARHGEYVTKEMAKLQHVLRKCLGGQAEFMSQFTPERGVMFYFTYCLSMGDMMPYSPIDLYRVIDRIRGGAEDKLQVHYDKLDHVKEQWRHLIAYLPADTQIRWKIPHIPTLQKPGSRGCITLYTKLSFSGHYGVGESVTLSAVPTLSQQNVRQFIMKSIVEQFILTNSHDGSTKRTTTAVFALNAKLRLIGDAGLQHGIDFDIQEASSRIKTVIFENLVAVFEKKHVALWDYLHYSEVRWKDAKKAIESILDDTAISLAPHVHGFLEGLIDNKQLWKCKPLFMETLGDRCKRSLCKSLNMDKDESDLEDSY